MPSLDVARDALAANGRAGYLPKRVERLLEAAGMALLGLGQGLEPVGDFVEAFAARGLGHARIHVGVFVGLARDRGLEIGVGGADRLAGRRIAHFFQIFQMAMRMAGLAFGGGAEHGGDIVIAFDIGLLREIEIAAVGLAFAGEGVFQIFPGLGVFQGGHGRLLCGGAGCAVVPGTKDASADRACQ